MKSIIIITLAMGLAGCQTVVQKPRLQEFSLPSELVDCGENMPPLPIAETLKNKDVGKYIISLRKVINECKLDNKTLKKYVDEYNVLIRKFNEENK